MRILIAPIMAVIFLSWVFYRAFITKDIKQHKNEVFGGFFFLAIWVAIYLVTTHL